MRFTSFFRFCLCPQRTYLRAAAFAPPPKDFVRREIIMAAHGDLPYPAAKKIHYKYILLDERQKVLYNNTATLAEVSAVYGGVLNRAHRMQATGSWNSLWPLALYYFSWYVFYRIFVLLSSGIFTFHKINLQKSVTIILGNVYNMKTE